MKKMKKYLTQLNLTTNIIILTLLAITLFVFEYIHINVSKNFNDESIKLYANILNIITIFALSLFDLSFMIYKSFKKERVSSIDSVNFTLFVASILNLLYIILEKNTFNQNDFINYVIINGLFTFLFFEMIFLRSFTLPNKKKELNDKVSSNKTLFSYFNEVMNKYNIFVIVVFTLMINIIYKAIIKYASIDICMYVVLGLSLLSLSISLVSSKKLTKASFIDLLHITFITSSLYLAYQSNLYVKSVSNPIILDYKLALSGLLLMIINIIIITIRCNKVESSRNEYLENYTYKTSFKYYINKVNNKGLLIILSILSVTFFAAFSIIQIEFKEIFLANEYNFVIFLIELVAICYVSVSNNKKETNFKDYFVIPLFLGMIVNLSVNLIFKDYNHIYNPIFFIVLLFITIIARVKTCKKGYEIKVEETSIDVVKNDSPKENDNVIYVYGDENTFDEVSEKDSSNEAISTNDNASLTDENTSIDVIEEIDIYAYKDVRTIDKYVYSRYFDFYYDFLSDHQIKILNIEDEHQINTLLSVFNSLNNLNDLENLLSESYQLLKKSEQLGLLHYEVFALYQLEKMCPNIKKDILGNPKYFIINKNNTYYNNLSKYSSNEYSLERSNFFTSFLKKYNSLNAITILTELYQEIRAFYDLKINKKTVRSLLSRCETSGYFDLYLLTFEYDYAKSKRQATKFLQEYDLSKDNQSQKVLKDFIDSLHKSEYIDTIIPFLAIFAKNIASVRRLFFEICTKINLISITASSHFLYDKFINVLVSIMTSYPDVYQLTDEVFSQIDDIYLLDNFIKKIHEIYGQTHKYSIYINNKLLEKIKEVKKEVPNFFELPKYSKYYIYIFSDYIQKDPTIKTYISQSITSETVFKFINSVCNKEKQDSTYHYELDLKFYSLFINKNDLIKLVKDNTSESKAQVQKYNQTVEIIKNKSYDTRLNIDFSKL